VAVYWAWESARPDALFRDPFAERLAGEQGEAIAKLMPRQPRGGWPLIVRTHLIDELILSSIADGCDCVINLAAGLDTRPYRMALPPSLQWIEVDLPAMIEEKQWLLGAETPLCRLARCSADLSDPTARAALLDKIAGNSTKTLVITEGLLVYLDENVVRDLANDWRIARNGRKQAPPPCGGDCAHGVAGRLRAGWRSTRWWSFWPTDFVSYDLSATTSEALAQSPAF
jgi:methyltransferase (TIGR00027 family)